MFPLTLRAKFEMFANALPSHGDSSRTYVITEVIILCKLYFYMGGSTVQTSTLLKLPGFVCGSFFFLRPHMLFIFQIFIYLTVPHLSSGMGYN